jgi:hypothetical protein
MASLDSVDYTVGRSMRQRPANFRMPKHSSSQLLSLLLVALLCLVISGCGQKGDLYLPGDAAMSQEDRQ